MLCYGHFSTANLTFLGCSIAFFVAEFSAKNIRSVRKPDRLRETVAETFAFYNLLTVFKKLSGPFMVEDAKMVKRADNFKV